MGEVSDDCMFGKCTRVEVRQNHARRRVLNLDWVRGCLGVGVQDLVRLSLDQPTHSQHDI